MPVGISAGRGGGGIPSWMQNKGIYGQQPYGAAPSANLNPDGLYGAAVNQNAEDYDSIMSGYKSMLAAPGSNVTAPTYNPAIANYQQSPESIAATTNLKNLSETGGYSEGDKADIRARGISPIRAVYANADRDINRQRALSGGYSPNYNASKLKMAREMSDLIAGKTTDINAGLAERIAQNKIGTAGTLASTTAGESALHNQFNANNANTQNQASQFNIGNTMEANKFNTTTDQNRKATALGGMSSIYGTTPALSNMFGNQALQYAQQQNQKRQNQNSLISNGMRMA